MSVSSQLSKTIQAQNIKIANNVLINAVETFRIVNNRNKVFDRDLQGLSLSEAESVLCRLLNQNTDCYLQSEN